MFTKILKTIFFIASYAFLIWMIISVADIVLHNLPDTPGYLEYASWNFFRIIM